MKKNKILKFGLLVLVIGLLIGISSFNHVGGGGQLEPEKTDSIAKFQDLLNLIREVDDSINLTKNLEKYEKDELKSLQNSNLKNTHDTSVANAQIKGLKRSIDTLTNKVQIDSLKFLILGLKKKINKIDSAILLNTHGVSELQSNLIKREEKIKLLSKSKSRICKKARNYIENFSGPMYFIYNGNKVAAYVSDLQVDVIRFHLYNQSDDCYSQIQSLKTDLEAKSIKPLMITNAGMFKRDLTPVGLFKTAAGDTKFPLDTVSKHIEDNFHLYPNGVFYIDSLNMPHIQTTRDFYKTYNFAYKSLKLATQSGPMLVIDNKIHDKFTVRSINEKIRSGVGIVGKCKVVFAVTVDNESFYNFASMLRDVFGCENALFLDGAISKMYLKGYEQINYSGQFGPMISISEK
jgi:uncharacterized protein YigE (DUF2233 family)